MTNNELAAKEINKDELPELPLELKKFITNTKGKKFHFLNSDKTIKDIDILYLLDEKSHKNISLISSKFLASEFTLKYLKIINEIIKEKYKLPQLTLDDFTNEEKMNKARKEIDDLKDEPIFNWLKEECLEELKDAIDNLHIDNIDKLVEFGHIINLSQKELSNKERIDGIELYDIFYRYLKRTNSLIPSTNTVNCKIYLESSEGELKIDVKISPDDTNKIEGINIWKRIDTTLTIR